MKKRRGSKGGRPTKLADDVAERILLALRNGNYVEVAAAFAGINKDTLYAWLKEGTRHPKGPYGRFSDAVQKALADAEARGVALVLRAATGAPATYDEKGNQLTPAMAPVWQAIGWWLERRAPERWGRRFTVTAPGKGGEGGEPVEITLKIGAELRDSEPEP